jgi:hypothetical protein
VTAAGAAWPRLFDDAVPERAILEGATLVGMGLDGMGPDGKIAVVMPAAA